MVIIFLSAQFFITEKVSQGYLFSKKNHKNPKYFPRASKIVKKSQSYEVFAMNANHSNSIDGDVLYNLFMFFLFRECINEIDRLRP